MISNGLTLIVITLRCMEELSRFVLN